MRERALLVSAAAIAGLAFGAAPALASAPLVVTTSVSPRFLYFADMVSARVTVVADPRQVDPGSIRLAAAFGAWDQLAQTETTSTSAGPFMRRSWTFALACVQQECLPGSRPLAVHLTSVTVTAQRLDNSGVVSLRRAWPALSIAPRFGRAPRGATPQFALDLGLPSATYRLDPTSLADLLDAAALVLAAVALWIIVREVLKRRPARAHELPPLVRALALVRQAKERTVDDRRRAAGLLARTLARDHEDPLSDAASQVAWSAGEPAPTRLEDLARSVEASQEEAR